MDLLLKRYVMYAWVCFPILSQGSALVKVLTSHQYAPDSIPAQCHNFMWVEFVVGSYLALRVFLRALQFSSFHQNQHLQIPNFPLKL